MLHCLRVFYCLFKASSYVNPMPNSMPRPCKQNGCSALTHVGAYCEKHKKVIKQQAEATRQTSAQRGYGYKWQKISKAFLAKHLWCECAECKGLDIIDGGKIANVVDHIKPHRGDMKLFWDRTNWQAMNDVCHNKKTAKEDGGFTGYQPAAGGGQKSTTFYL